MPFLGKEIKFYSYWKQPDRESCKSGTSQENKHYLQPQTSSAPATDTSTLSGTISTLSSLIFIYSNNYLDFYLMN